eukprot:31193-Pelagococcus_subviridis.AAC.7
MLDRRSLPPPRPRPLVFPPLTRDPTPYRPVAAAVGRKKIRIERIADERNRQVRPRAPPAPVNIIIPRPRSNDASFPRSTHPRRRADEGARRRRRRVPRGASRPPPARRHRDATATPPRRRATLTPSPPRPPARKSIHLLPSRARAGHVHEAKERPHEEGDGTERLVRLPDRARDFQQQQQAVPVQQRGYQPRPDAVQERHRGAARATQQQRRA